VLADSISLGIVHSGNDLDATASTNSIRATHPSLAFLCVRGERAEPHVTVRAMILSLTRFGIAAGALEKDWAAYRPYGRCPGSTRHAALSFCGFGFCVGVTTTFGLEAASRSFCALTMY
jgi:hypothetical protein